MGSFVADAIIKQLILTDKIVKKSKVLILGVTFKENCPDIRNSKVVDIVDRLKEYGINPYVVDPYANPDEVMREYGIKLSEFKEMKDIDCIVHAVAHEQYANLGLSDIENLYKQVDNTQKVFIDVKGIRLKQDLIREGYVYWCL